MLNLINRLASHRELVWALAWKNIVVRYKQAYLGLAWAVLRPVMLMLIFMLVRAFVDIDTGGIPYPLLTYTALLPWILFQDATTEGVSSVVQNASLIRKIYFPREIFPLTAVFTKLIEFGISLVILIGLMGYYGAEPSWHALWAPLIILYTVIIALAICFFGSAINVYIRDISAAMPVALTLLMYASPVVYPLSVVRKKLLDEQIAGDWSANLYALYTANPLAGVIDSFQRVLLLGLPPDFQALAPGLIVTTVALPLSYRLFKGAEAHFADVI